jgi:hypothetical protein
LAIFLNRSTTTDSADEPVFYIWQKQFFEITDPPARLHLLGEIGQTLRTDDDVEPSAVGIAQLLEFRVAADAGQDADAELVKEGEHPPQIAGNIIFTNGSSQ